MTGVQTCALPIWEDKRLDILCCFYSPCSNRVIQIQPHELSSDAGEPSSRTPPPRHGTTITTSTRITTTVQAFTQCDAAGQHIVTILPPTSQISTSPPSVVLSPSSPPPPSPGADVYGSQLFAPTSSSTRDLLAQMEESKEARECVPLPFFRWNLATFAREKYAPLLLKPQSKVVVVVVFVALLGQIGRASCRERVSSPV